LAGNDISELCDITTHLELVDAVGYAEDIMLPFFIIPDRQYWAACCRSTKQTMQIAVAAQQLYSDKTAMD